MNVIKETYVVRFDLPMDGMDGLWLRNVEESVVIYCTDATMKIGHKAAENLIKDKYPECRVSLVTYV